MATSPNSDVYVMDNGEGNVPCYVMIDPRFPTKQLMTKHAVSKDDVHCCAITYASDLVKADGPNPHIVSMNLLILPPVEEVEKLLSQLASQKSPKPTRKSNK